MNRKITIITIEKTELIELIEEALSRVVARALSPPDRVMSKAEIAEDQRTSIATITRWMKQGMPYLKGGRPRFRKSEVEAWRRTSDEK